MAHSSQRLLAMLEVLQTQGLVSGSELARRLEIDVRTLRRDIARLEEMGIPITAERGRDGGYRLMHGFKLPPMMFTNEEALALSLGLQAARSLGLAQAAPAVSSAQAKLERVLPDMLRHQLRAVAETVTLDLTRTPAVQDNAALMALSTAAQLQQRVQLKYQTGGVLTERQFDPYSLAWRDGHWYAVGYCHLRKEMRSFRLDRMLAVRPVPASFLRPEGFDVLAFLNHTMAIIPRDFEVEVILHAPLEDTRRYVYADLGILESTPDGTRLRSQADTLSWMARQLAQMPYKFTVISPPALIDEIHALAQQLLRSALAEKRDEKKVAENPPPEAA
ncbi:helix-turn-helix transcriptional regulator [Silvimonas amylolytica]|uniref:Transcriptional regulator n=1 Tax=Silvimonas amylolytica TaxID=449663 RepID=A0ABQ2PRJ9_9NEIS|nr:YafY family protein [Silvimonas amylolytica]GGP27918.1 transcriptional regulator [Silvimonas amylolytica]